MKTKIAAVERRLLERNSGGLHSGLYNKHHKVPAAVIRHRFKLLRNRLALMDLSEPSRDWYLSAADLLQDGKNGTCSPSTAQQISALYTKAMKESKSNCFEHRMMP